MAIRYRDRRPRTGRRTMSPTVKLNPNVIDLEYAVRGPIPQRAAQLAAEGVRTIPCNIGNPQALGQKPLTFFRQVMSLIEEPDRIRRERALHELRAGGGLEGQDLVPGDAIEYAADVLERLPTGTGAYTESNGPRFIREAVARFIDERDDVAATGAPAADPDAIFLTNGASEAVRHGLDMLVGGPEDGIMIPIPQYPLYSATIMKVGGTQVDYYPSETDDWAMSRDVLEASLAGARARGITVRAIVVINPGNPTGAILPDESIRDVIDFAEEHGLVIMADEVYQENLYGGATFTSFAKVLGTRDVPLMSFHSTSKGFYGECGKRGGYVEVRNPPAVEDTDVRFTDILMKLASVNLCSNVVGHLMTYLMVNRPRPGDESHELFARERDGILAALETKATMIREAFTEMDGMACYGRTGAMYLFPRIGKLPAGTGDFEYCMSLLEETGLCTVNGSGFGQEEGTHHLRIAFLPPTELLEEVLPRWIDFHNAYVIR
jgi:aspartate/methionine/tyrosine aminotransferase